MLCRARVGDTTGDERLAMWDRRRVAVILRLLVRGVAHRKGVATLILFVAVAAGAAAAAAPDYRAAAGVSALRAQLVAAPANSSGVEVSGLSWPGDSPDVTLAKRVARLPLSTGAIRGMSMQGRATQLFVPGGHASEFAALQWREDQCAHVVFVTGRCPTSGNEIALPISGGKVLGATIGGEVDASALDEPTFGPVTDLDGRAIPQSPIVGQKPGGFQKLKDTVVGFFDVPPGQPYWFGQNPAAPAVSADGTQTTVLVGLVPRSQLVGLPPPFRVLATLDQPLDWSHADLADSVRVEQALTELRRDRGTLDVFTDIPSMLSSDAKDRSQLNRLISLAQLQLLLLVGLVLVAILAASMDRRRAELVIATLQGRRPASTALSIAAEPILLLAIGVVPGVLISAPLASIAAHLWLRAGTGVHLTESALVAALVVTAIAALVTVIIAFIAANRPLGEQLAEDARAAGGRGGAWIDLVAITLAVAGVIELFGARSGSTSTPWSLLAPSLTGLAGGLLLGRLVPALLRPAVRASVGSGQISRFLALRELRRDRAAWRVAAVVALALSLLGFAISVNNGASADRTDRAGLIVGAPKVVDVLVPPGVSLIGAVDRADPGGHWAMAAELIVPYGSLTERTLAIDTSRLPAVAGWTRRLGGYTPRKLVKLLAVSPAAARLAVPLLTAGDVEGSTWGLNNELVQHTQPYPVPILPRLLNAGSLADLPALSAAAKPVPQSTLGTTLISNQVWLGSHAPADALQRLRAGGLTVDGIDDRARVQDRLDRAAQTAGLEGYDAVGVLAALLAVALLIGMSVAAAGRQRTETLALTSAGVSRSSIVRGHAIAAAVRLGLVAVAAVVCAIVTARLSVHLIPQAAPGTVPAPLLRIPVAPALLAVVITLVPALIAEVAVAAYATKRADATSLRAALP
jgi:hypothetical protein